MIKRIISKLLDFWDIYGGIITTILVALIVNFEKVVMDKVTSFTSMLIVITSVFVYIKIYYRREKKSFLDALILSDSPIKSIYPFAKSNDISKGFKKIKENKMDIKKKLYTLFNNKWTIISLLWDSIVVVLLIAFSCVEQLKQFTPMLKNETRIIIAVIIAICYLIPEVYTTVTKYGIESYAEIISRKKKKLLEKSNPSVKEKIEEAEEDVKDILSDAEPKSPYDEIIEQLEKESEDYSAKMNDDLSQIEANNIEIGSIQKLKEVIGSSLPKSKIDRLTELYNSNTKLNESVRNAGIYLAKIEEKIEAVKNLQK